MNAADADAARRDATAAALAVDARALAGTHRDVRRARGTVLQLVHYLPSPIARSLERARAFLSTSHAESATPQKASEWFLDNYYLVRRVARQIKQDLPPGFVARLPLLTSGDDAGMARVDALANVIVSRNQLSIDASALRSFVDAYQQVSPLTIAELWALPTMLRISVLRGLLHFLEELHVPVHGRLERAPSQAPGPDVESLGLSPVAGVERSIRALRLLSELDWEKFFESTSRVEAILQRDPAAVYSRMDFETCDSYRKAVEGLAWETGITEPDVAEHVVDMALQNALDARRGHVGYYLVDAGRRALEARIGYRARGVEAARRAVLRHPTLAYLSALALGTGLLVIALGSAMARSGARPLALFSGGLLAVIPVSVAVVTLVQWGLSRLLSPRLLPKLDFGDGLPQDCKCAVVIPTLLGRVDDVDGMLRQIELHYLSNRDPLLEFALLTDDVDARAPREDTTLLDRATQGIAALNAAHGGGGAGPFHLLHRAPRWNAAEGRFMGWERKRGKLEEWNRLLRGAKDTSFTHRAGDPGRLDGIRFVITVDSDTQLPMGTARRLVGTLAHPLNRATFDDRTGRVASGYTIVQPRIEMSPSSARATRFSQIFGGDVGFDIYTHAVSESYQDLFGAGIYVGKGIYEIDAFMRSVKGRVPENALASHDLFEGIAGRAGLASDIVLFEDYPAHYAAYARRMHRWVRGDWQLLPWLWPVVPSGEGGGRRSPLTTIDRWKILDNVRRSLTGPAAFLLLVLGLTWLPGSPVLWTLGTLVLLLFPSLPGLVQARRRRGMSVARCALAIAFLANESALVLDAVARVLVRLVITRKHLLQWTAAAHAAFGLGARSSRWLLWREMMASPCLAVAMAVLVARTRPSALPIAAPLLLLWLLAPEIARWVSAAAGPRTEPLRSGDRRRLRLLARRTWRFFDVFVGPNDQWLPIDNTQEAPYPQQAHRTSPTNIGMMLLSTLAAYDLGYLGALELSLRLRNTLDSIKNLVHYQGHLLNWYGTKDLQPLLPRYVSTVDSGNFAGCLVALAQGCRQVAKGPVLRAAAWQAVTDSLDLLEQDLASVPAAKGHALAAVVTRMRRGLELGQSEPSGAYETLRVLCDDDSAALDRELLSLLDTGALRHDADTLRALRMSIERFHQQLRQMRYEVDLLLPWLPLKHEATVLGLSPPVHLRLDEVPGASRAMIEQVAGWRSEPGERGEGSLDGEACAARLTEALTRSASRAEALGVELLGIASRADAEAQGMDFRLLYDAQRQLFHIGYNATLDQLDGHHYDLLASEARLASYLAIVKGDVPAEHWAELGRPMTQVSGSPLLLSWGGTMFEYLMPALLMRSRPETLLAQTGELAVDAHIAYGIETDAPWGISESGHARLDASHTYQYQSFGVPGLGFRRGLEEDLVIAPYACVLAASVRPRAVLANLERLEGMGMIGTYGLFEAVDMRPEGAEEGRPFAVVRSHMAHHQGMILVALDNLLNDQIMVERFHADRQIETGEILLNERAPAVAPREWPKAMHADASPLAPAGDASPASSPWSLDSHDRPAAFVLSNGRLSSLLTAAGGGGLRWRGLAVTRYQPDVVGAGDGTWIHVRDQDSGRQWIATSEGGRTTFEVHKAEFHQRDEGVSLHVEVSVAPAGDVEVRLITLHNETQRTRQLRVSSVAEPVLLPLRDAATHPAFGRLFLESEWVEQLGALVFSRRPQSPTQPAAVLVHRLVGDGPSVRPDGYETDRAAFFGRCGTAARPASLSKDGRREGRVGAVLDPVLSLSALVELAPQQSVTFAFVTSVARTRSAALDLVRRYGSMHAVRWALRDADQEGRRRLARARLSPELLPVVSQLFSALLFADRTMRAPQAVLAIAHPCKSHLWGRGISGDDPIVLVRVHDPSAALLTEVVAAQAYLRSCGVSVELVLLDESATGYLGDAAGALREVLVRGKVDEWLGRRGGIFVLSADQLRGAERADVEAAARVVLDTTGGGLASAMARPVEPPARLPRFEPTRVEETVPGAPPRPALLFDNGTGGFTEDGREYVVSVRPGSPTPAPWCNVLCNPDFGCLVSESSLGSTWSLNAGENRLTPWRNDPVFDTPSEVLYLRDEESAAIWSPTPLPAGGEGETLVRHGAGYTTYSRDTHGLGQELTVFVPDDAPLKVVRLKLRNNLPRHRRLTATYYAEWVLGSLREGQRAYVKSELDEPNACLLATCSWNAEFASRVAFLASELPLHGFATDRAEFLGRRGDLARPEALERWGLAGGVEAGVDPCAAVQVHLELGPGEEIETHFVLGQASSREEAMALVERFRKADAVATAWQQLGAFWDGLLGSVQVKTPEPAMDLMLNRWLLYQTLSARLFARTAFYQSSGAFGFRDQLQDVLALLHAAPDRARAHILEAARHQFLEGDVLHWWHPPAGRGVRTRCSDDLAWLPFVTAEYVQSTGDESILSEPVTFLAGDPLRDDEDDRYAEFAVSPHSASLLEHCRLALVHADTHGPHGLPLMGGGDWNDGMNRVGAEGRGESVWLAWFLCATMDRFAALCERRGDGVDATSWRSRSVELRDAIEVGAWDGAWYVRAFHDDGSVLGSDTGRECRIDSIAQSWAVLSRVRGEPIALQHRARRAVQAADERLVDEPDRLIRLLWPPFDVSSHDPGYIGAYPPGVRENGGQYTHAATWLGWAYVELGEGAHAERIFRLLNPVLRASTHATSELYRIEPYVLAGDVYGATPWVGRGGWSWYTGAAAWAYRLGVEGILGLRREEGVLCVDPCIPPGWKGFEAWVHVGAQRVHIVVDNAAGNGRGIAVITVDGVAQDSNRIALDANASGTPEVRVQLARAGRAASHAAE